jgi:hypothetical protein
LQKFQNLLCEIKYNIKILFGINIVAAIIFVAATPVFYSLSLLDAKEIARLGELYLSIIGIILFTYLPGLEEANNTKELVYAKTRSVISTFAIRFLLICILTLLLILAMAMIIQFNGGNFNLMQFTFGITVTAVFLGVIGLTIANYTNEASAGYLVAFAYFIFEWITRGKYTGDFYLNSLLNFSFAEKYRLLAIAIGLILINIMKLCKR